MNRSSRWIDRHEVDERKALLVRSGACKVVRYDRERLGHGLLLPSRVCKVVSRSSEIVSHQAMVVPTGREDNPAANGPEGNAHTAGDKAGAVSDTEVLP